VQQLFRAREIDARLNRCRWMAHLLVERASLGVYPPVPNGLLNMDTAWRCVLGRCLGLDVARPDAAMLLNWSLGADSVGLFDDLPAPAKPPIVAWLSDSAGAVGTLLMRYVLAGSTQDAVPLGLVCGVLLSAQGEGVHDLVAAAIRLERFIGDKRIGIAEGRLWAADAASCLKALTPALRHGVIERAEWLLRELHVDAYAHLSDVLPLGLEQRLGLLVDAFTAFIVEPSPARLQVIERAADSVACHTHADPASTRLLRVKMAVRLCRWLLADRPASQGRAGRPLSGFADLAHRYAGEGAFVDWARCKLIGGDDLPGLSSAFVALRAAARQQADAFNRSFAEALQIWNREPRAEAACLPVEAIVERLLAPLARQAPVLLLVADGLSYSMFRELGEDLEALGWDEQLAWPTPTLAVGIAAPADDHRSEPQQPVVGPPGGRRGGAGEERVRDTSGPRRRVARRHGAGGISQGRSRRRRGSVIDRSRCHCLAAAASGGRGLQRRRRSSRRTEPDPGGLDDRRSATARTLVERGSSRAACADHYRRPWPCARRRHGAAWPGGRRSLALASGRAGCRRTPF